MDSRYDVFRCCMKPDTRIKWGLISLFSYVFHLSKSILFNATLLVGDNKDKNIP